MKGTRLKFPIPTALLLLQLFLTNACTEQPQVTKQWYKGNLHTHSYWSDGDEFPEMIMEWYKSNNYHFVALSDHNILAKGDYWIELPERELYQNAFKNYLSKYGNDWVVHKEDSGRIEVKLKTYEEYKPLFEEKGKFLIIQSEEITDRFEDKHIHVNATNIQELIEPQGGESVLEVLQNNINEVLKQRQETGVPMIPHINHPNFHYSISLEDMIQLKGERFFEVFNGHPQVHNFGDSVHISTEEMWDQINIAYLSKQQPLIYGLATDDSHHYHEIDSKWSNAGRGWIMVQADSLNAASLIDAMEEGKFYATTGITLSDLRFENNELKVEVQAEEGVHYKIEFIGCKTGEQETKILNVVEGNTGIHKVDPEMLFVRAKITSDKPHSNPIETANFEMAWTQPVVFEKE